MYTSTVAIGYVNKVTHASIPEDAIPVSDSDGGSNTADEDGDVAASAAAELTTTSLLQRSWVAFKSRVSQLYLSGHF